MESRGGRIPKPYVALADASFEKVKKEDYGWRLFVVAGRIYIWGV